jgi:diaminopimelate decarboxylase
VGIRLSENLVQELLTNYGSPLYVYDLEILRHTIGHITRAISGASFYFAAVTNGNVSLLKTFQGMGWGLHANTPGDIYLAKYAGFSPKQIVYSGSNLSSAEMRQVLEWGVTTLNFDSLVQLQQFVEVARGFDLNLRLGLRLNFPALTGNNRIGVRPEEFAEAVAIAGRSTFIEGQVLMPQQLLQRRSRWCYRSVLSSQTGNIWILVEALVIHIAKAVQCLIGICLVRCC